MTLWEAILFWLLGGRLPETPQMLLVRQLRELDAKIANQEYQMKIAEMADDRYYTNGRRRRDLDELRDMKSDRKFILDRLDLIRNVN